MYVWDFPLLTFKLSLGCLFSPHILPSPARLFMQVFMNDRTRLLVTYSSPSVCFTTATIVDNEDVPCPMTCLNRKKSFFHFFGQTRQLRWMWEWGTWGWGGCLCEYYYDVRCLLKRLESEEGGVRWLLFLGGIQCFLVSESLSHQNKQQIGKICHVFKYDVQRSRWKFRKWPHIMCHLDRWLMK